MKYISLNILLLSFALVSCDQISKPYGVPTDQIEIDTSGTQIVLLEEYTGHKCGECPEGTEIAHHIKDLYGSRVILISVHAGHFARTDSIYSYDFRFPESEDLFKHWDVLSNPIALMNRRDFSGKKDLLMEAWESAIQEMVKEISPIELGLTSSYDEISKEFSIKIDMEFLEPANSNLQLAVYLTESHIISFQREYRNKDHPDIEDYEHNHALRATVTGAWGEKVSEAEIAAGDTFTKEYTYKIEAGKDWVPENMHIVAFVHDHGESYEILQVAEDKPVK